MINQALFYKKLFTGLLILILFTLVGIGAIGYKLMDYGEVITTNIIDNPDVYGPQE